MPSSATITAFYTFAPNTKARSSQVNANFSIFRGHILPVDPNTQTAATTNTYDLGSTEYHWRNIYGEKVQITANGLETVVKMTAGGANPGVNGLAFSDGTTGSTFIFSSATVGSFVSVPGSTLTLDVIGRPVQIWLTSRGGATETAFRVYSTTDNTPWARIHLNRNTTTSVVARVDIEATHPSGGGGSISVGMRVPLGAISFVDLSAASGTHNYFLTLTTGNSATSVDFTHWKMCAKEIL